MTLDRLNAAICPLLEAKARGGAELDEGLVRLVHEINSVVCFIYNFHVMSFNRALIFCNQCRRLKVVQKSKIRVKNVTPK